MKISFFDTKNLNVNVHLKTYILGFFIALLVIFGMSVIAINYYVTNGVILRSAKTNIKSTNKIIEERVGGFFSSINTSSAFSVKLFKSGVLSYNDKGSLNAYLIELVKNHPSIVSGYVATPAGDFYMVNRLSGGKFSLVDIRRSREHAGSVESYISKQGKVLKSTGSDVSGYDPRVRPWYKDALRAKKRIWTDFYKFQSFTGIAAEMGITSAAPVYQHKKLICVVGFDMDLNQLSRSMRNLLAGDNAVSYLMDSRHNIKTLILASQIKVSHDFSHPKVAKSLNDLNLPWAEHAFGAYVKDKKAVFTYSFKQRDFLTSINALPLLANWHVITVRSVVSVEEPYKSYKMLAVMFLLVLLSIVIASISYLAGIVISPIERLAKDANKLRGLEFSEQIAESSRLIELAELREAMNFFTQGIKSFTRYVPFVLVKQIMQSGTVAHVSGESRQISVLFSDIQGFTSISENLQPRELMLHLAEYFETVTKVIKSKTGTLDKYIGDAVMAFWGAPMEDSHHPLHACQCALMLNESVEQISKVWQRKGMPPLKLRIGLSAGYAVVGNVGSSSRLSYTAMGDTVNLASRLEELNKIYHTSILVSEDIYRAVSDQFLFRMIDCVAVKGKKKSVYIYELLERGKSKFDRNSLKEYNTKFNDAFNYYRISEWQKAFDKFVAMAKEYQGDRLLCLYIFRCRFFLKHPPKHWDGVWDVTRVQTLSYYS